MLVRAHIDTNEVEDFDITALLLNLDEEVGFELPSGEPGCGILKSVAWREEGIIRLYIEPCDRCRDLLVAQYN